MNSRLIKEKTDYLVKKSNFLLRPDVRSLIEKALSLAEDQLQKTSLRWILENAAIAAQKQIALCQDTGLPVLFIRAGKDIKLTAGLINNIEANIADSYRRNYLRASIVDPLIRKKPGYMGILTHVEFNSRMKGLELTLFPKGFGSENKTQLKMFNPTSGESQIEDFIVESVKKAGPNACPPFIIGVGIGGTCDYALLLAKKALINRVDIDNKDHKAALLEKRILRRINRLNIGPMGFRGKFTALAVNVRKANTHIAGLPVGVNISCWALRSATVRI